MFFFLAYPIPPPVSFLLCLCPRNFYGVGYTSHRTVVIHLGKRGIHSAESIKTPSLRRTKQTKTSPKLYYWWIHTYIYIYIYIVALPKKIGGSLLKFTFNLRKSVLVCVFCIEKHKSAVEFFFLIKEGRLYI